MKIINHLSLFTLVALLSLCTIGKVTAQSTIRSPLPQEINWGTEKAFDNNIAYTIVESDDALPLDLSDKLKENPNVHDVMIVQK